MHGYAIRVFVQTCWVPVPFIAADLVSDNGAIWHWKAFSHFAVQQLWSVPSTQTIYCAITAYMFKYHALISLLFCLLLILFSPQIFLSSHFQGCVSLNPTVYMFRILAYYLLITTWHTMYTTYIFFFFCNYECIKHTTIKKFGVSMIFDGFLKKTLMLTTAAFTESKIQQKQQN